MGIVKRTSLFSEEENLGDLEKLKTLISVIPAEKLLKKWEEERGNGWNDYPVVCMWCLYNAKFFLLQQTIFIKWI